MVGATVVGAAVVGAAVVPATPSPPSELHAAQASSTEAASTRKVVVVVNIMVSNRRSHAMGRYEQVYGPGLSRTFHQPFINLRCKARSRWANGLPDRRHSRRRTHARRSTLGRRSSSSSARKQLRNPGPGSLIASSGRFAFSVLLELMLVLSCRLRRPHQMGVQRLVLSSTSHPPIIHRCHQERCSSRMTCGTYSQRVGCICDSLDGSQSYGMEGVRGSIPLSSTR